MTSTKSKYSCVELSDGVVVKNNETGEVLSNITPTGLMTQGVLQIKTSVIVGVTEATGAETHHLPTLSKITETLAALPTSVISALDTIGPGDIRHVPTTNYMSQTLGALPTAPIVALDTVGGDTNHLPTTDKVTDMLGFTDTTDVTLSANHTLTPATGAVTVAGGYSVAKNMIIGNGVNKNFQFFTTDSVDANDPHFATVTELIDVPQAGGLVNPRILMAGGTGPILSNTHSMMDMTYFYDDGLMYYDIFPTAAFVGTPQFNFYRPVFAQGQLGLIKSHVDGTHISHLENCSLVYPFGSGINYSGMKVLPDEAAKGGIIAVSNSGGGQTVHMLVDSNGIFYITPSGMKTFYTKEVSLLAGVRTTGAGAATLVATGDFLCWSFAGGADNDLFMTLDMPHDWEIGTPLEPHIHFFAEDNTAGDISWTLSSSRAVSGAVFTLTGGGVFTSNRTNTVNPVLNTHVATTFDACSTSSVTVDGMCVLFRLRRNGSTDSYNKQAFVVSVGCHYRASRWGS